MYKKIAHNRWICTQFFHEDIMKLPDEKSANHGQCFDYTNRRLPATASLLTLQKLRGEVIPSPVGVAIVNAI